VDNFKGVEFSLVWSGSIGRGGRPGSPRDTSRPDRGLKPCTGRCCHKSWLARGRDPCTGSQSRPSDWDTRHHGSIPLSGKPAGRPQYNLAGKCRQVWGPLVYQCPHCTGRPGRMGWAGTGCLMLIWRSSLLQPLGFQLTGLALCSATSCKYLLCLLWVPPQCQAGRNTRQDGQRLCSSPLGYSKANHRRRLVRMGLCRRSHSRRDHWGKCCAARMCTLLECSPLHRSLCILRCRGTLDDPRLSCCQCQVCSMHWGRRDLVCKDPQG